jgi:hypothetical protein
MCRRNEGSVCWIKPSSGVCVSAAGTVTVNSACLCAIKNTHP